MSFLSIRIIKEPHFCLPDLWKTWSAVFALIRCSPVFQCKVIECRVTKGFLYIGVHLISTY